MLIFDTETTGLIKNGAPLQLQPRIIEIGVLKVHEQTLEITDRFQTLLNPGIQLEPIITEITGLTDDDLARAPTFARVVGDLSKFMRPEPTLMAHNAEFDKMMLVHELQRINWEHRFPFPTVWIDTVGVCGGLSLDKWSKKMLGDEYVPQSHRAIGDCERLLDCWRKLREQEAIE